MNPSSIHWMPYCTGTGVMGKGGLFNTSLYFPLNAKQGLVEILHRISEKGLGSFLAVLKVFGKQESIISFPRKVIHLHLIFQYAMAC